MVFNLGVFDMAGLMDLMNSFAGKKEVEGGSVEELMAALKKKDIYEVARVIAAESASDGTQGMMGVAHVINNRGINSGTSPLDVVSKKNQFYGYTNKNKNKIFEGVKEEAVDIATKLYDGNLGEDFTQGATYFRQPSERVSSWHGDETITIGNHIFHKESK